MTPGVPQGPPARIARFVTAALAIATCGVAVSLLVVDFDSEGLLRRPPPPAPARGAWLSPHAAAAVAARAMTQWPATPEGVAAGLDAARPAMVACLDAWSATDPAAPRDPIAVARFVRSATGEGRVRDVAFEDAAGGTSAASCLRATLAGTVLADLPDAEFVVRFPVRTADP